MAIHHDYFFDDPDATLLATTLNFQRNWLNLYEAATLESIQMAQSDSIRGTTPLLAYFPITKAGVRPKPRFDKSLKTRHKGPPCRRKTKVNPASLSAHCISYYFTHPPSSSTVPSPMQNPIQQQNSSQQRNNSHQSTLEQHNLRTPL
jgi:hypothetical protein